MKLRDYFLLGIKAGLCKRRIWMNLLFNIVYNTDSTPNMPYKPFFEDDQMYFYMPDGKEKIYIDDYIPGRAPLHFRDEFILLPGEIENYKGTEPLRTTYGNVFCNYLCLVLPFGDIFPFQTGYFSPSKIESEILERMIDDREDGNVTERATDGKLYVWQYLMFADHCLAIPAYADSLVTSVTRKSMTASPDRDKVRAALLEQYKDQLTDPAIIAKIGNELIKLDEDYLAGDESYEFYDAKHAKLFGGVRKKVHYLFGGESPFSDGTSVELISKSLEEGIDTDHMPVMNNSLRYGSYNRGAQTALGGESTKTIYRMVGTVRIIEPDCETKIGVPTRVDKFNQKELVGYTMVKDGVSTLITAENIGSLFGTIIDVRGPMTCKSGRGEDVNQPGKGKNICATCAGKALAENPNGIPAAAAGVGGRFLSIFMSKMHSATLRTVKWEKVNRIS